MFKNEQSACSCRQAEGAQDKQHCKWAQCADTQQADKMPKHEATLAYCWSSAPPLPLLRSLGNLKKQHTLNILQAAAACPELEATQGRPAPANIKQHCLAEHPHAANAENSQGPWAAATTHKVLIDDVKVVVARRARRRAG